MIGTSIAIGSAKLGAEKAIKMASKNALMVFLKLAKKEGLEPSSHGFGDQHVAITTFPRKQSCSAYTNIITQHAIALQ